MVVMSKYRPSYCHRGILSPTKIIQLVHNAIVVKKFNKFQKNSTWKRQYIIVSNPIFNSLKGTVSLAERCDFVGVKLEKVHELFQVCRICGKGVVFYNMAQCGLLYHKSLQLITNLQFI